jgi:hypothetical protein
MKKVKFIGLLSFVALLLMSGLNANGQEESKSEVKKNSIRLDFFQRSFGLGLTYDRVLYS